MLENYYLWNGIDLKDTAHMIMPLTLEVWPCGAVVNVSGS